MERRREPRLKQNEPVLVTLLTSGTGSGCEIELPGRTLDASGRGLRVAVPAPFPPGSLVKLGLEDSLVLAEVCHCGSGGDGYVIGLQIDQVLSGLHELQQIVSRQVSGASRKPLPSPVKQSA